MKAITTKYHGPTNVCGSRIGASDLDGNRVMVGYDHSLDAEENHKAAAVVLCRKMLWGGIPEEDVRVADWAKRALIGGAIKGGYAWVFRNEVTS